MKTSQICILLLSLVASAFIIGCGSASDDLAGVTTITNSNNYVTLTGYVKDGSLTSLRNSSRIRYSLSDLSGIKVFLENYSNLYGITDSTGKYTIANVPQGRHTLVAEKQSGMQIQFRARKENIPVIATNGASTVELSYSDSTQVLTMQQSNYSITLRVTDNDGNLLPYNTGLAVYLWGTKYQPSYNNPGIVELTDFPNIENTVASITATGYKPTAVPVTFGENYNSDIYVRMPKTTESTNVAPIVAITYNTDDSTIYKDVNDILTIQPNRQLNLLANGYDANGDSITYNWSATSGSITGYSTTATFIATQTYSNVTITLTGTDNKGASGKAELLLAVYGGIATGTPIPFNPGNGSGTPDPFNPGNGSGTPDPFNPGNGSGTPDPFNPGNGSGTPDPFNPGNGSGTPDPFNPGNGSASTNISGTDYSNYLENTSNWSSVSGTSLSMSGAGIELPSTFTALITDEAYDSSFIASAAIYVDLASQTFNSDEAYEVASFTDDVLYIYGAGTYVLSGDFDGHVSIPDKLTDGVTLVLNGASINGQQHCAIYNAKKKTPLKIVIADGTTNYLTDVASYSYEEDDEPSACLFSKGDLVITGNGTLNISANGSTTDYESDGIQCKGDNGMIITGGIINVNTSGGTAIKSKVDLVIDSSYSITLIAGGTSGKGIKTKGDIYLKNAILNMTSTGDCIKAENDWEEEGEDDYGNPYGSIYIENGKIAGTTTGDGIQATDKLVITGGTTTITTTNTTFYLTDDSSKGIKSGCDVASGSIHIYGGTLALNTKDHAIKSKGTIDISGNPAIIIDAPFKYIASGETEQEGGKGITGTGNVTIGATGTPIVRILNAEEGIESKTILTIAGGDIKINTWDDGMNVGGTGTDLNITGGTTYVYAEGDGIDSNGNITVTGGTLVVNQANSQDNSALDLDGTFKYSGGTVIGAGNAGMDSNKSNSGSGNLLKIYTGGLTAGKLLNVQDSSGNSIITFAPAQNSSVIEFGSSSLLSGNTYNVYIGGSTTSTSVNNGIFSGGNYTAGTLLGSITINSTTSTVGTAIGGMGPGGNQPGGNPPNF